MADEQDAPDDPPSEPLAEYEHDNASDPKAVRKKAERVKRAKDDGKDFWRKSLSTAIGRAEIWALLQSAGTFEERFACGPNGFPQPEATWFYAGSQAFGQRFYQSLVVIDRVNVFLMHDENDVRFAPPKPVRRKQLGD